MDNNLNVYDLILSFLNDNDKVNTMFNKLTLNMNNDTKKCVDNILLLLTQNGDNNLTKNFVDGVNQICSDGKLDVYDIPTIINIITNVVNLSKIKFDMTTVTLMIKILIHILIELQIIKTNENENIDKLIDSSVVLLNTTIKISNCKMCCKK